MSCVCSQDDVYLHTSDSLYIQYVHDTLSLGRLQTLLRKKLISAQKNPKEIILHCAHHSPADRIFIDQFHNLLDALRTFPSRWFPSTAEVVFTIQINARRATLLLIFPTASFKLPSANEIHIL